MPKICVSKPWSWENSNEKKMKLKRPESNFGEIPIK